MDNHLKQSTQSSFSRADELLTKAIMELQESVDQLLERIRPIVLESDEVSATDKDVMSPRESTVVSGMQDKTMRLYAINRRVRNSLEGLSL